MCGIAGIFDLKGELNLRTRIDLMLDEMKFRGPDDKGQYISDFWAVGMRRLSIVDLTNGGQPQTNEDGEIFVVHNGEIYNHETLRSLLETKGHIFTTFSDTEIIVHGYEEWGIEGLLAKIEGMFAFAIVDKTSFVVHLARDRFGEKPLYICGGNRFFSFSSDLKALRKSNDKSTEIDLLSLSRYLALHFIPGNRSIWQNYERLLPGERVEVKLEDLSYIKTSYYQLPANQENSLDPDQLNELIEDSIKSRLMGDVPVGVFLSGGLDSSIITSYAAKYSSRVEAFSIGFESNKHDESFYAREVARNCGVNHHSINFKEDNFREQLSFVSKRIDEPLGDPAALPTSHLSRAAKDFVKVVLTGEGADEIFAGYDYYRGQLGNKNLFRKLFLKESITSCSQLLDPVSLKTPSGFPLVSDISLRESLLGYRFNENEKKDHWEETFLGDLNQVEDPLRKASIADILTWLPSNLLTKLDRMTMLHSIEGRCPFLMKNLAEYAVALPATTKVDSIQVKKALREISVKYLPVSISNRKKQGFILPMQDWLANYISDFGGPKKYVEYINCNFMDEATLINIIDQCLRKGVERVRLLYSIVMLLEWSYSA